MQDRSPPARRIHLQRTAGPYSWVNLDLTGMSARRPVYPPTATELRTSRIGSFVPGTDSCAATNSGHQISFSGGQLIEQHLCLLQVERVGAFAEPDVDRSEEIAGFIPLALIAPEPRHARGGTEFPGFSLLCSCDRKRTLKISFRFR